jgi:hypothetical protein
MIILSNLIESAVEKAALAWLEKTSWPVKNDAEIAPGELFVERAGYGQVILEKRLRDALLLEIIFGELRLRNAKRIEGRCF